MSRFGPESSRHKVTNVFLWSAGAGHGGERGGVRALRQHRGAIGAPLRRHEQSRLRRTETPQCQLPRPPCLLVLQALQVRSKGASV
eukprot:8081725-Pyramimonas_sp.AAC.1